MALCVTDTKLVPAPKTAVAGGLRGKLLLALPHGLYGSMTGTCNISSSTYPIKRLCWHKPAHAACNVGPQNINSCSTPDTSHPLTNR